MAKPKPEFVCQQCGTIQPKWAGQCPGCLEWNTFVEEKPREIVPKGMSGGKGRIIELFPLQGTERQVDRYSTSIAEFDRVTGGGLVPGSIVLIGGDPGIGKSTLLLQVVAKLSLQYKTIYVSGEESVDQVRLRARRLEVEKSSVELASATNVRDILSTVDSNDAPDVLIIDSIQTMYVDSVESAPGSVSQVRASAQELIRVAKKRGIVVLLVGHVTKEGTLAGPRVLEHMVDTVLYFEGDRGHQFRILRSVKNRFGGCDEIGVFEMTQQGLQEVPNPSALFLSQRKENISGSAVFAGMEGSRPMLVEIQALVAPSTLATPRRAVIGWDSNRLAMILAVLEARCGVHLSGKEIYLNVAGGLKIQEPAADLAVAAAILSALGNIPLSHDLVIFGEIGLSGEIRAVAQPEARLKESSKLGFKKSWSPVLKDHEKLEKALSISCLQQESVHDLLRSFALNEGAGKKIMKECA